MTVLNHIYQVRINNRRYNRSRVKGHLREIGGVPLYIRDVIAKRKFMLRNPRIYVEGD